MPVEKFKDPISYQGSRGTILFTKAKVEYTEQIKQWHIMNEDKNIFNYQTCKTSGSATPFPCFQWFRISTIDG